MAVTTTVSNHFKYRLATKQIDLDNDTVKVLLMRDGFTFDRDTHAKLINIKSGSVSINTAGNTITVSNSANTFTRTSGSFLTDGFVVGNLVTTGNFTNAANNGDFLISTVTALVMTVTTTAGGDPTLTDETQSTNTVTFESNDELATGSGYTQGGDTLGASTVTEDDTNNRAEVTYAGSPSAQWTASGGDIGPTPGAIVYDDTDGEDTIIAYIDFDGDKTATDGTTFNISDIKIRIA